MAIRLFRGTRTNFAALVTGSSLVDGRLYYITDEKKFLLATGTNTFVEATDLIVRTPGFSSGTLTVDLGFGIFERHAYTMTANVTTLTLSNLPGTGKGMTFALQVKQNGTGGLTFALPSSFKATSNSDTAIQSGANAYTQIVCTSFDNGTRWNYTMKGVAA